MKKIEKHLYLFAIIIIVFSGCTKYEVQDGPKGNTGAIGNTGNANVIVVDFPVPIATDSSLGLLWNSNLYDYRHYKYNITALNSSVIDSGAVMLYMENNLGWWDALPKSIVYSNSIIRAYNFSYGINLLYIHIEAEGVTTTWLSSTQRFKLVIIPSDARASNPNINLNNYEEVKRTFNLQD